MKKSYKIILITNIILFIILSLLVLFKVTEPLDSLIASFAIGMRNDHLTNIVTIITNIGGAYSLILITTLLLIFIKNKKVPFSILINLVCVFLTSQLFKLFFHRPRPDGVFLVNAGGFGYPSGHAMVSTAYFAFLIYLIMNNVKDKFMRILLTIILSILTVLISLSRIYLGVHYFTDIVGAVLLAIAYLTIFITIIGNKKKAK
jgi:undecaprenyl-diphosphatase